MGEKVLLWERKSQLARSMVCQALTRNLSQLRKSTHNNYTLYIGERKMNDISPEGIPSLIV